MYLFVFDFDNTIARTFEKGPKGIDVNESYRLSVRDIFGEKGLQVFEQIGGLHNRAPEELVQSILKEGSREDLTERARRFFDKESANLGKVVPEGKGIPLVWDTSHPDSIIGEMLVRCKLVKYLLPQIGTRLENRQTWPRPCEGFPDFYRYLQEINSNRGIRLETAIISSGHETFIEKTFQTWGLSMPDYFVTDDDIRGRRYSLETARRVIKPGLLPLILVRKEWLRKQERGKLGFLEREKLTRERIIHFGDDPQKDGIMAQRAKIPFGLFKEESQGITIIDNQSFTFGDWRVMAKILREKRKILQEGRPLLEMIFPQTNGVETFSHHGGVERF